MAIPNRVSEFLAAARIPYEVVKHDASVSSVSTAALAQVPMHEVAKAVMLEDHEGRRMMAILPADRRISLSKLNEELSRSFRLLKEAKLTEVFEDCGQGAVPPIGGAYYVETCWDEALGELSNVYLEAGDHSTLLHLQQSDFLRLMKESKHLFFSSSVWH